MARRVAWRAWPSTAQKGERQGGHLRAVQALWRESTSKAESYSDPVVLPRVAEGPGLAKTKDDHCRCSLPPFTVEGLKVVVLADGLHPRRQVSFPSPLVPVLDATSRCKKIVDGSNSNSLANQLGIHLILAKQEKLASNSLAN
jgi:hypothetical protein